MTGSIANPCFDFVIAVCDDEGASTEKLAELIKGALKGSDRRYEIRVFDCGSRLLEQIEEIDVAFLDVDMPGENGLAVGKRIKEIRPECMIVMATGREDCFKEAFCIQALRYITKPFEKKEVFEAVNAFLDAFNGDKYIKAYYNRNLYKIKQSDILYIRAMDSYSEIVLKNYVLRTEKSMALLESELDSAMFYRIHKQYIVNMAAVETRNKDSVIVNGIELGVSRRKRADFEMKYIEFDLRYR